MTFQEAESRKQKAVMLAALVCASAAFFAFPHAAAAMSRTNLVDHSNDSINEQPLSDTTSSFTVPQNALVVAVVGVVNSNGVAEDVRTGLSITSTGGLTWTKRANAGQIDSGFGYTFSLEAWTAQATTSKLITLTLSHSAAVTGTTFAQVIAYNGHNPVSPIGFSTTTNALSPTNGAGTMTITTGAPRLSSAVVASRLFVPQDVLTTATPGVSWTELFDRSIGDGNIETMERVASSSLQVYWTDVDDVGATVLGSIPALAIEIRAISTLSKPPNNLGLVGYWSFEDATSTRATDFSGNGNHGTLSTLDSPLPSWANGKRGNGIDFDGGDFDYVQISDAPSLQLTGSMTVCAWAKADTLNNEHSIAAKSNAGSEVQFVFYSSASGGIGGLSFYWTNNGHTLDEEWATDTPPLRERVWYHLCAVRTGDTDVDIYVDGVSQPTSQVGGGATVTTASTYIDIGLDSDPGASGWDGLIDEVRVYNRALSASEIASLARSGAVKFTSNSKTLTQGSTLDTGLVGLWTFDGADVNWTASNAGVAYDRSGQNNTGTLTNMNRRTSVDGGKLGQALIFDGSSNYVRINSVADDVQTGAATVSLWFKPSSTFSAADTVDQTIFSVSDVASNNDLRFRLRQADGFLNWQTWSSGAPNDSVSSISSWDANTWYHVVGTISADGSTKVLYVNSVQENLTTGLPARGSTLSSEATIGVLDNLSEYFDGVVDDVRVYSRALTATEVKQLYNLGGATIRP